MESQLKRITIVPEKLDADGNLKTVETATVVLAVPMTPKGRENVKSLLDILNKEWVNVSISPLQLTLQEVSSGKG